MDGTPFGRYRLVELLGSGGVGQVWRAHDTVIDRVVALKVLPANFTDDQLFQQRFRSEVSAAAGLDEPHVIPIYDLGEIEGRLFVSMRLINGRTLRDLLDGGALAPARAVGVIEQIASALHAAHAVGLVHRDVKPSNILVAAHDFSYLTAFGVTRPDGTPIDTWAYMAPERFGDGTADARADIYALTCVLYHSLTGQPPFPGVHLERIPAAHMMQPPPQPSAVQPAIPQELDHVIATGMAKDPDNRYATAVELATAAREAITTAAGRAPPAITTATVRHEELTQPAGDVSTSAPPVNRPADDATQATAPTSPPPSSPERQPTKARWWRRKTVAIAAAVSLAVIGVVAAVTVAASAKRSGPVICGQRTVPFIGIRPQDVAVGSNGTVYVTDFRNKAVVSLAAGSTNQTVLPFTELGLPDGVAVDSNGTVYVADSGNNRVVSLAAGSTSQTVLPFTGLSDPSGVEVDSNGTVYVADENNNRVVSLAAGSTNQTVLPFTGLYKGFGVAVDSTGTVYVADEGNNRVLSLAAGSTDQTVVPFTGLRNPFGVAVDSTGTVYVADDENNRVLSLPAGSTSQTVLPFTGLRDPTDVAVDSTGAVYVADYGNNRVVSLPAEST